jgi:hypothetical protein
MNTIPAQEIKRRGISALDELLKEGPVQVIKNNRPRYVVMSAADYAALIERRPLVAPDRGQDIWDLVLNRPWEGTRSREAIDASLREERDDWGEA